MRNSTRKTGKRILLSVIKGRLKKRGDTSKALVEINRKTTWQMEPICTKNPGRGEGCAPSKIVLGKVMGVHHHRASRLRCGQ